MPGEVAISLFLSLPSSIFLLASMTSVKVNRSNNGAASRVELGTFEIKRRERKRTFSRAQSTASCRGDVDVTMMIHIFSHAYILSFDYFFFSPINSTYITIVLITV